MDVVSSPLARPCSASLTPSVAAIVSGPYASAKAVPATNSVGSIARYGQSMPTGRNSPYATTASTKPPTITRACPNRATSRGVRVGASTASHPMITRAIAVWSADQPRSSCKYSVTTNWKPKKAPTKSIMPTLARTTGPSRRMPSRTRGFAQRRSTATKSAASSSAARADAVVSGQPCRPCSSRTTV